MKKLKDFWNNKWEKRSVVYSGRALRNSSIRIDVDVRNFICVHDDILKQIVEQYSLKKKTHNETAHACQKFVVDYISYKDDATNNYCEEFWQFPFETLASKVGDCEDGAILMASLMIVAGIPNWRVKVVGGLVQPEPTAPTGGHAYCIYLADREKEMEWEVHDWCYYEDSDVPTGSKPRFKDGGYNGVYKDIWFTFNDEFCWSTVETKLDGRINQ